MCILLCIGTASITWAAGYPQRLVVLSPHLHTWVVDLDLGQHIIAAISGVHLQQTPHAVALGRHGQMSAEKIVSFKPDLVLAWEGGNRADLLKQLRHVHIPVFALPMDDIWAIPSQIKQVGLLLGAADKGRGLAAKYQQRLLAVQQRYRQYPAVKVFYQMGTHPFTTSAAHSWPQQLMEICHAENVFATVPLSYFEVSPAQVVQAKPALIVTAATALTHDWLRWGFAPAQIQAIPMQALHQPNAAMLPALEQMCATIHTKSVVGI